MLEILFSKFSQLEEANSQFSLREKGYILEKTRLISLELSKLKATIMKSKINYEDRSTLLSNIKPF